MKRHGLIVSTALAALLVVLVSPALCGERELLGELRTLVDEQDETFLLGEIRRIQPFYSIRRLARFQQNQDLVGGGFCGCLPGQLMNANEIPLPVDDIGVLQAAVFLAEQRKLNQDALSLLGCPMAPPPMRLEGVPPAETPPNMTLRIDWSVLEAFLDALGDGEVTMDEAREISRLPVNREMLRSICVQHKGDDPCVTEETLMYLIWKAGSADPLDRLWRWLNPMNDFGYAEIAVNANEYRQFLADLQVHQQDIEALVLSRVASCLPPDREIDETCALTIGCLTPDWATPTMSGANVLWVKNGWQNLVDSISYAVCRQHLVLP